MDRIIEKLRQHKSPTRSKWREEAEYRQTNLNKLKRSREIAIQLLSLKRNNGMTVEEMAKATGFDNETIHKLLRGKDIFPNDTLSKIENFLFPTTCIVCQDNQMSYSVHSDSDMI